LPDVVFSIGSVGEGLLRLRIREINKQATKDHSFFHPVKQSKPPDKYRHPYINKKVLKHGREHGFMFFRSKY
jgi:hypothetical protein